MNESLNILGILHDIANKAVWEILLLIFGVSFSFVIVVACVIFIITQAKDNIQIDLSFLKIGKKNKEEEAPAPPPLSPVPQGDINIIVNNATPNEATEQNKETEEDKKKEELDLPYPVDIQTKTIIDSDPENKTLIVISKSIIFGANLAQYRDFYLTRAQMGMTEVKIDLIESILIKEYMENIFKKRGYINIQDDQSYLIFFNIVTNSIHKNNLNKLRLLFKQKSLSSIDEDDFDEYLNTEGERYINELRIKINSSIPTFVDPGIETINNILNQKQSMIMDYFKEILVEARNLSTKVESTILAKEKEFDEEIRVLTGIKNVHKRTDFMIKESIHREKEKKV